jgi:hypothetical protein
MFKVRVVVNHKSGRMTMERTNKMAVNVPMENELVGLRSLNDASYRESKMNEIRNQAK